MKRRECFKNSTDNWYPCYDNKLVKVSFMSLGPDGDQYRVCVWGADDFGMERDFDLDRYQNAETLFTRILEMEDVTQKQLTNLGMVVA